MDKEKLDNFLEIVKADGGVNMYKYAIKAGLDWDDILTELSTNEEFSRSFLSVLQKIKFELLQGVFEVAKSGKKPTKPTAELSYVKAIISFIDGGIFQGKKVESSISQSEKDDLLDSINSLDDLDV